MATLNLSLPNQLKNWVSHQIDAGKYSSASDYLRDLIREDIRQNESTLEWLMNYLKPLSETPEDEFISSSAADIKSKARLKLRK